MHRVLEGVLGRWAFPPRRGTPVLCFQKRFLLSNYAIFTQWALQEFSAPEHTEVNFLIQKQTSELQSFLLSWGLSFVHLRVIKNKLTSPLRGEMK